MAILFANNAKTTTTTASLAPGDLSVVVSDGSAFPSPTGGDYFYATIANSAETAFEIVKVTARTTNTMTIVRAQDGTTAQTWTSGSKFELRLTRAAVNSIVVPVSSTSGSAVFGDQAKCIVLTAGLTIPASVFGPGDAFTLYNNSASDITITQGSGLTLRLAGSTGTGNRTLSARALSSVWFLSATEAIISGSGLF